MLSRDTATALCVCVCCWLMFSSYIRIPVNTAVSAEPESDCWSGAEPSHASQWGDPPWQRGGAERMGIIQLRDSDASGQKAIDWSCPAAPTRNEKCANWKLSLGKSRIPATDCSYWILALLCQTFVKYRVFRLVESMLSEKFAKFFIKWVLSTLKKDSFNHLMTIILMIVIKIFC